jgi:alcohol dehydrogenase (cytochrome c)
MKTRIMTMMACTALLAAAAHAADVGPERLLSADAEPENWITYYGNYAGWRHSGLRQIDTGNVQRLVPRWTFLPGADEDFQATPLVVDGVMYVSSPSHHVFALDATNGRMLWRYVHQRPEKLAADAWGLKATTRGVAVGSGKVLLATIDGQVIALDARTGQKAWAKQVADPALGQYFKAPPLVVGDKAVVGTSTGELANRGFVAAISLADGSVRWRFETVPGPGQPGNETWSGDSWKRGCAPVWSTATDDSASRAVFVVTGNPCPMWNGDVRKGDNLYSNSVLALDEDTGALKWHFQVIPHDVWDLDATSEVMLVDTTIGGRPARAALTSGKHGFLVAVDRDTGGFLYAKPVAPRITWTRGFDAKGRPSVGVLPGSKELLCPGILLGAKGWQHGAYSPELEMAFLPVGDICDNVDVTPVGNPPGPCETYMGGEFKGGSQGAGMLRAVDVRTGEVR